MRAVLLLCCGLAACSSQDPNAVSTPMAVDVCDGDEFHPSRGLSPAHAVEYVSLRKTVAFKGGGEATDTVFDETGTVCQGATDPSCAQHTHMTLGSGWQSLTGLPEYILVTSKDDVVVYPDTDSLLKFLGTIDTAHEAALLARSKQLDVDCTLHPHAYAVDGGFRVLVKRGTCTDAVVVRSDGQMGIERNVLKDTGCTDDIAFDGGVDDAAPPPPDEAKPL